MIALFCLLPQRSFVLHLLLIFNETSYKPKLHFTVDRFIWLLQFITFYSIVLL